MKTIDDDIWEESVWHDEPYDLSGEMVYYNNPQDNTNSDNLKIDEVSKSLRNVQINVNKLSSCVKIFEQINRESDIVIGSLTDVIKSLAIFS